MHDVDLSIVNALRRIGLQDVPNVALDFDITGAKQNEKITLRKNTGVLHNEFFLHRLSLVPFCFSLKEIDEYEDNQYLFKLKIANTSSTGLLDVTTQHIEIYSADGKKKDQAFHKRILPPNSITGDYILLTKLKPGEEIDLDFKLSKGTAQLHSRWCPVSQCTYSFLPAPQDEGLGILASQRNFQKNKYGEPNAFKFSIQSECAIAPGIIFKRSIDILRQKIVDFIAALEKNDSKVMINNTPQEHFYHISIRDEDHTLVNVLQSCIYNFTIRDQTDKRLIYIGYCCPHPLDRLMVMKVKMADETDVKSFLIEKCNLILGSIEELADVWNDFSSDTL